MHLESFPRTHRILKKDEFQTIMTFGIRKETKNFILFLKENEKKHHRLGIIASKKVGGAVIRNKAKRILREYFRKFSKETLPAGESQYDVIFICRKTIKTAGMEDILKNLRAIL